jgi:hypothetical protein
VPELQEEQEAVQRKARYRYCNYVLEGQKYRNVQSLHFVGVEFAKLFVEFDFGQ